MVAVQERACALLTAIGGHRGFLVLVTSLKLSCNCTVSKVIIQFLFATALLFPSSLRHAALHHLTLTSNMTLSSLEWCVCPPFLCARSSWLLPYLLHRCSVEFQWTSLPAHVRCSGVGGSSTVITCRQPTIGGLRHEDAAGDGHEVVTCALPVALVIQPSPASADSACFPTSQSAGDVGTAAFAGRGGATLFFT